MPANETTQCFHGHLVFGEGGYFLECGDCGALWSAIREDGTADLDRGNLGLGRGDLRIDPRLIPAFTVGTK